MLPSLLIFHTNRDECSRLRSILRDHFDVAEVHGIEELSRHLSAPASPRLVFAELLLPRSRGIELVQVIRRSAPTCEVVVLSPVEAPSYAVASVKAGAFGFLTREDHSEAILAIAHEALEHAEIKKVEPYSRDEPVLTSKNASMLKALRLLPALGQSERHALVTGEIGTGRKTFARAISRLSSRGMMRFVNCADAARESVFTMLGVAGPCAAHEVTARQPLPHTICLLNVEQLPPHEMTSLNELCCRPVLVRLTNSSCVPVQFRVVAVATLRPQLGTGAGVSFDFLRATVVELPALRHRMDDLPELCAQLAARWGRKYELAPKQFSRDALAMMATYGWPGNILELSNLIERLTLTCPASVISSSTLPLELHIGAWRRGLSYRQAIERLEREFLQRVLDRVGGCRRRAAERLQLSYSTLKFRLRKLAVTDPTTSPVLAELDGASALDDEVLPREAL